MMTEQISEQPLSIEEQFWEAVKTDDGFDGDTWFSDMNFSPDERDSSGYPAIVVAYKNGRTSTVKKLLAAGADANSTGPDQYTLLMRAASQGDLEFARWLLDNTDIDINAQDKDGDTALNESVYHKRLPVAELLFDRGADPYILNYKKENLWDWAKKTENQQLMGMVYKRMYPAYKNFTRTGHHSVTTTEKTPEGAILSQTFNFKSRMVSTVVSGAIGPISAEQSRFSTLPARTIAEAGEAMRILDGNRKQQHRR